MTIIMIKQKKTKAQLEHNPVEEKLEIKKTAINIIRLREVTLTICMLPRNIFTFTNNFSIKFQFPDISTESCPQDGTNISRNNNEMLAFLDRYYLLSKL
jgi:hypothetical protein